MTLNSSPEWVGLRELVERMEHRVKSHMSRPHHGRPAQIAGWHYYFDEACDRCNLEKLIPALAQHIERVKREARLYGVERCRESMTKANYERIIAELEKQG